MAYHVAKLMLLSFDECRSCRVCFQVVLEYNCSFSWGVFMFLVSLFVRDILLGGFDTVEWCDWLVEMPT